MQRNNFLSVQKIAVLMALILCVLVVVILSFSDHRSDESLLRAEFNVPSQAKLVHYKAHPSEKAWVRENLTIDVVFQLSDRDYDEYVSSIKSKGTWQSLPIPNEFLRRMGAVETTKAQRIRAYQLQGKTPHQEGSVYNPTEEQLLTNFIASLPNNPQIGLFQCRSAGDNIMYAPKIIHTQLDRDLNDFMLAMLDHERKQMVIQVSTSY